MNTREKLFLIWAIVATCLLFAGGVAVFQMLQPRLANTVRIGGIHDFPIGSHTLFECDRHKGYCQEIRDSNSLEGDLRYFDLYLSDYERPWIWVTHDDAKTWRAFLAVSPHRGCFVDWNGERNQFGDPWCASSEWDSAGKYYAGPSPRDLDSYPIREEFGNVILDFKLIRGENTPQ